MKLTNSRLCLDCEEIFDLIRTLQAGAGNARVCPACTSTTTVWLSTFMQPMKDFEKNGDRYPAGDAA